MNDPPPRDPAPRRLRILDERTVRREGAPDVTNPYWLAEEPAPHPDPSRGCIRRGICCRTSPGWFAPGEVEKAAALLEMTPDEFVRAYVIIDGVERDGEWVEAFAPVKLDRRGEPALPPGSRADELYRVLRGPCVFFDGDGCRIYGARPIECSQYVCTNPPEANPTHVALAALWRGGDS